MFVREALTYDSLRSSQLKTTIPINIKNDPIKDANAFLADAKPAKSLMIEEKVRIMAAFPVELDSDSTQGKRKYQGIQRHDRRQRDVPPFGRNTEVEKQEVDDGQNRCDIVKEDVAGRK